MLCFTCVYVYGLLSIWNIRTRKAGIFVFCSLIHSKQQRLSLVHRRSPGNFWWIMMCVCLIHNDLFLLCHSMVYIMLEQFFWHVSCMHCLVSFLLPMTWLPNCIVCLERWHLWLYPASDAGIQLTFSPTYPVKVHGLPLSLLPCIYPQIPYPWPDTLHPWLYLKANPLPTPSLIPSRET